VKWLPLLLVLVIGCDFADKPLPLPPSPSPAKAIAADGLRTYGSKIADAFERAADQSEKNVPVVQVINEMGDALKAARVDSFTPLMERLNGLESLSRAKLLRQWAAELREASK
jgi:hypothetical protein